MTRTTSNAVRAILGNHYDGTTSLEPFIDTATAIVDKIATCATARSVTLGSTLLERIECWLAAHYYAHADQLMQSEGVGRGQATYQGQTGKFYESTQYGQAALGMDLSGCLASFGRQPIRMNWLGKAVSDQTAYEDRD